MGWMVEALEPGGLRGLCRKAIYASWAALFGKRVEFILAMGNLGVRSFRRVGFSKTPIFPFGYTVEVSSKNEALARSRSRGVEIAFVGRLEAFKGVDNLLRAVASNDDPQIRLFLIGDGALRSELEMLAAHLELNRRVQFLGAVPNSEARRRLRSCDLLVLPSRYDGWGAVVNEALMEGIPVVCSDRCGAADLLADSWRGEVFPWNNQQALLAAVKARCSVGPLQEVVRKRIRDWSACLTGDSMAEYFLSVMEHVYCGKTRPEAPWANARAGAACAVDPLRESFRGKQAA